MPLDKHTISDVENKSGAPEKEAERTRVSISSLPNSNSLYIQANQSLGQEIEFCKNFFTFGGINLSNPDETNNYNIPNCKLDDIKDVAIGVLITIAKHYGISQFKQIEFTSHTIENNWNQKDITYRFIDPQTAITEMKNHNDISEIRFETDMIKGSLERITFSRIKNNYTIIVTGTKKK